MNGALVVLLFLAAPDSETDAAALAPAPAAELGAPGARKPVVHIETPLDLRLGAGFQVADSEGSQRAAEYREVSTFPQLDATAGVVELPHRLHLDAAIESRHEGAFELTYAWKDVLYTHLATTLLFHNFDPQPLRDAGPSPRFAVESRGTLERPHAQAGLHDYLVRGKIPNEAVHFYARLEGANLNGRRDVHFLGGSGSYDQLTRVEAGRHFRYVTSTATVGANAHLGPIEADYSHAEKRFSRQDHAKDYVYELDTVDGPLPTRYGFYPNQLGRRDMLKLHTSYTGRLVASATVARYARENQLSKVEGAYDLTDVGLQWLASHRLSFTANLRYERATFERPAAIETAAPGGGEVAVPLTRGPVRASSYALDLHGRYRPFNPLTVSAELHLVDQKRPNGQKYLLPARTSLARGTLRAKGRVSRWLQAEGWFSYAGIGSPSYTMTPNFERRIGGSASWLPTSGVQLVARYENARARRHDLAYTLGNGQLVGGSREATSQTLNAMLTLRNEGFTFVGVYGYISSEIEQMLVYDDFFDMMRTLADPGATYRQAVNVGTVQLSQAVSKTVSVGVLGQLSVGKTTLRPVLVAAAEPTSIGEPSHKRVLLWRGEAFGSFELGGGWAGRVSASHDAYRGLRSSVYDPIVDGNVWLASAGLTKQW